MPNLILLISVFYILSLDVETKKAPKPPSIFETIEGYGGYREEII